MANKPISVMLGGDETAVPPTRCGTHQGRQGYRQKKSALQERRRAHPTKEEGWPIGQPSQTFPQDLLREKPN
jgi:hypothetical protein